MKNSQVSTHRKAYVRTLNSLRFPLNEIREHKYNGICWNGEHDQVSPKTWTLRKKRLNVGCILFMSILSYVLAPFFGRSQKHNIKSKTKSIRPLTSVVIAPAISDVMTDLHPDNAYLFAFILSSFVLGYAFGLFFVGPFSELLGRVPLYHVCNAIFTICTIFCGRAGNVPVLTMLRFFAGMGGSSVFALAPRSLADMYAKEERGTSMTILAVGYNLGPVIGPIIGSYVNKGWGWRWIFYLTGISGTFTSILNAVFLSETCQLVILRRKTKCLHRETGNMVSGSGAEKDSSTSQCDTIWKTILMPLRTLSFSLPIHLVSFVTAIAYGLLYILYTTTLPATLTVIYTWKPEYIGFAYLGIAIGNLGGVGT